MSDSEISAFPADLESADLESNERLIEIAGRFRMRSPVREIQADTMRFEAIFQAIDQARESAVAERTGLIQRIKTIVLRVNDSSARPLDDYPQRRSAPLMLEFNHAEARLAELSAQIGRFEEIRKQVGEALKGEEGIRPPGQGFE